MHAAPRAHIGYCDVPHILILEPEHSAGQILFSRVADSRLHNTYSVGVTSTFDARDRPATCNGSCRDVRRNVRCRSYHISSVTSRVDTYGMALRLRASPNHSPLQPYTNYDPAGLYTKCRSPQTEVMDL